MLNGGNRNGVCRSEGQRDIAVAVVGCCLEGYIDASEWWQRPVGFRGWPAAWI